LRCAISSISCAESILRRASSQLSLLRFPVVRWTSGDRISTRLPPRGQACNERAMARVPCRFGSEQQVLRIPELMHGRPPGHASIQVLLTVACCRGTMGQDLSPLSHSRNRSRAAGRCVLPCSAHRAAFSHGWRIDCRTRFGLPFEPDLE
jgi:hypothetical protein